MVSDLTLDLTAAYLAHRAELHRYLVRRTSPEEAEEFVQATFVKALDAQARGRGCHTHVRGWLFRIAHNLVVDHYAQRARAPETVSLEVGRPVYRPDYAEEVSERVAGEALAAAAAQIPPKQAAVVRLLLEGYSYVEAAEALGMNVGAVKGLRHRALDSLRPYLAGCRDSITDP